MTVKEANELRATWSAYIYSILEQREDIGMIASNSFNFPVTTPSGEEGWIEITVKVPKDDDGYEKRDEYTMRQMERAEKAKAAAEAKAKKMAKDKKRREEKENA